MREVDFMVRRRSIPGPNSHGDCQPVAVSRERQPLKLEHVRLGVNRLKTVPAPSVFPSGEVGIEMLYPHPQGQCFDK